jgi:hypothetical protein
VIEHLRMFAFTLLQASLVLGRQVLHQHRLPDCTWQQHL